MTLLVIGFLNLPPEIRIVIYYMLFNGVSMFCNPHPQNTLQIDLRRNQSSPQQLLCHHYLDHLDPEIAGRFVQTSI